jgi:hypothetical protein
VRINLKSFNGGFISREAEARTDINSYPKSCREVTTKVISLVLVLSPVPAIPPINLVPTRLCTVPTILGIMLYTSLQLFGYEFMSVLASASLDMNITFDGSDNTKITYIKDITDTGVLSVGFVEVLIVYVAYLLSMKLTQSDGLVLSPVPVISPIYLVPTRLCTVPTILGIMLYTSLQLFGYEFMSVLASASLDMKPPF